MNAQKELKALRNEMPTVIYNEVWRIIDRLEKRHSQALKEAVEEIEKMFCVGSPYTKDVIKILKKHFGEAKEG
jgi:hypothetical protein